MTRRNRPERTWTPTWDERGVSDVLAFVFVFSIIITSVGLVTAVGFKVLGDIRQSEQALNAERAMQSLSENLGEIQRGHAPGRTGELKLSNGAVYVRDGSEITVTIDGGTGTGCSASPPHPMCATASPAGKTFALGTLYYNMEDRKTNVTYESGAVFREDRGGAPTMSDEPRFLCRDDYAVISVVTLRSDAGVRAGEGTVQIVAREERSKLHYANKSDNLDSVTVSIDSRFATAWEAYFKANGWTEVSDDTYECTFSSDPATLFVRRTIISIQFVT